MSHSALTRLCQVRASTVAKLQFATAEELSDSPFGYPWSVKDILTHLASFDDHLLQELRRAARRPKSSAPTATRDALTLFDAERDRLVQMLSSLSPSEWSIPLPHSSHPLLIGRSISEATDFAAYHEWRHGLEIDRHLAATRSPSPTR